MNADLNQKVSTNRVLASEQAEQTIQALKKPLDDLELRLEAKRISAEMKADPTKRVLLSEIEKRLGLRQE